MCNYCKKSTEFTIATGFDEYSSACNEHLAQALREVSDMLNTNKLVVYLEKEETRIKVTFEGKTHEMEVTKKPVICQSCGEEKICYVPIGTEEKDSCLPVCKNCLQGDECLTIKED